jgi:hypothetical protein
MATTVALPAAGVAQRLATHAQMMATQAAIEKRVEKICEAIGSGPGDVAVARYIAGLEVRIAELEKRFTEDANVG